MRYPVRYAVPTLLISLLLVSLSCRGGGYLRMIEILSILPTGHIGLEGDDVTFSAIVDSPPGVTLTYVWAFPTGVTPEISTAETPLIHLDTAGNYQGTLTVDGSDGSSAMSPFTYEIGSVAPQVLQVVPVGVVGLPAGDTTFSALVEGTVTSWTWEFGDGATPSSSTEQNPTVALGEVGIYTGQLTVGNDSHTATAFEFEFQVNPPVAPTFRIMDVAPARMPAFPFLEIAFLGTCAFTWNGFPGVFFNATDGIHLALATTPNPQSAGDWNDSLVIAGNLLTGTRVVATTATTLHVLHFGPEETNRGRGLFISTTAIMNPSGPGDWTTTEIDATVFWQHPAIIALDEGLLVAFQKESLPVVGQLITLAYVDGFAPLGPGDWTIYSVEGPEFGSYALSASQFLLADGRLSLLYNSLGFSDNTVGRSWIFTETLPPLMSTDWDNGQVLAGSGSVPGASDEGSLLELNGNICILLSFQVEITFEEFQTSQIIGQSNGLHPAASLEWTGGPFAQAHQTDIGPSANVAQGRAFAAVRDFTGGARTLKVWRQITANPTAFLEAGSWVTSVVDMNGSSGIMLSTTVLQDGRILLACLNGETDMLRIIIAEDLW